LPATQNLPMPEKFQPHNYRCEIQRKNQIDGPAQPKRPFEIFEGYQCENKHREFARQHVQVLPTIRLDGRLTDSWIDVDRSNDGHQEYRGGTASERGRPQAIPPQQRCRNHQNNAENEEN
jgi:hypothetical protein